VPDVNDSAIPDIAVIGAGPCGIGVGIAARDAGLACVLFDKGAVAASLANYPVFMTFFSTAERLEIGGVPFIIAGDKPTRREAIRYYQRLADHFRLDVRQYHTVTAITNAGDRFRITTRTRIGEAFHEAKNVVIATGYFDHPNRLGVPGEDLGKLSYGYREGHPFFRQNVVIVGGGNSAVDAALELFRWKANVTIVHFADALDPGIKPWVLPDITGRIRARDIDVRFRSRVAEIRPASVLLRNLDSGNTEELPNDWVLAMTGFTPDPSLLRELGVHIDSTSGIPFHDPESMRTNVDGVFIAGVLAAGFDANKVFIENGRDHGPRIVRHLTGSAGSGAAAR
jgi:thioredoxin reductase (NADPH)